MTAKQKQCLLAFLGFYAGDIDGIWGTQSQRAAERFLRAFGPTEDPEKALKHAVCYGMLEYETKDFWDEIEFFDREEFQCTCGGRGCNGFPTEPVERLVRNAESARVHFGAVADVSSGVRCQLRNSELPGSAANSLHMRGKAMDFRIRGVRSVDLLTYVRTLPNVDEAYAIDEAFVHMGVEKY